MLRGARRVSRLSSEAHQRQLQFMQEDMCLVVDERDAVFAPMSKEQTHLVGRTGKAMLHRAFSVFLFHPDTNKLLLQKRSQHKLTFPLCWTNTCCSHPLYGRDEIEAFQQRGIKRAALRKIDHELGVTGLQLDDFQFKTRVLYHANMPDSPWGEHEIDYILLLRKEVEMTPNEEEVADTRYVDRKELDSMRQSTALSPWLIKIMDSGLLDTLWDDREDSYDTEIRRV